MGKQYTNINHNFGAQVPFPSQTRNQNNMADWRRTIGMNTPPEPRNLHTPAGPAPENDCTSTRTPPALTSTLTSATDPDPDSGSDSDTISDSSSDNGTWQGDDNGSCNDHSDYGDDDNGGSPGSSSATSMSAVTTHSQRDGTEETGNDSSMDGISDNMADPDITPAPTAYQRHLKDKLHLLAEVTGENYHTLVAYNNAPIIAALAMCYDSDAENSETESSIGGDSGYGADIESGADDAEESERRRRSDAPPPQSRS